MSVFPPSVHRSRLGLPALVVLLCVLVMGPSVTSGRALERDPARAAAASVLASSGWVWPAASFRLSQEYVAPAHRYGAGHRGIDLEPSPGSALRAPADGTVAFSGRVAGRGILTIDHGGGLVTTLEPVSTTLEAGTPVLRAAPVASLDLGGHAPPGTLHFGVRLHGEYINPMLLLGGVPRAVLLPCC